MKPLRIIGSSLPLLAVGLGMAGPAMADTTVTPAPVTFVDVCGTDKDTYIIPNTTGVGYYVNTVKQNAGVRSVDKNSSFVEIFTVAEPGYTLSAPATWSHEFDATTGCAPKSTPSASSSPSSSDSITVPSSTPSTPAPTATDVNPAGDAASDSAANSSSSTTSSASELPRTGADVTMPLAAAGLLAGVGAVSVVGARRMGRTND